MYVCVCIYTGDKYVKETVINLNEKKPEIAWARRRFKNIYTYIFIYLNIAQRNCGIPSGPNPKSGLYKDSKKFEETPNELIKYNLLLL